jgi:2-succinyl-5-enolpyruvyl-6-hydroxy-3-cyclohexene-1-carboxylate synthase
MNSAKKAVVLIAEICKENDISKVVFSPGSRSAPLVIAFSQIPEIECIVIPDERVAGYFALGMAQQTGKTVALVCTSGTAVLNLGPATCEAFYQRIPLLLLTADRPKGAVDKGENQAIAQAFAFKNFTKLSLDLDGDDNLDSNMLHTKAQMEMALEVAQTPAKGPVHLNIRLSEPLYEITTSDSKIAYTASQSPHEISRTDDKLPVKFTDAINSASRKLIIVGVRSRDEVFNKNLATAAARNDFVVLAETTSNVPGIDNVIYNYDACLDLMPVDGVESFSPDMVITFGNQIISKKIRQFLRVNEPKVHWHVDEFGETAGYDLFNIGVHGNLSEKDAFDSLLNCAETVHSDFSINWQMLNQKSNGLTQQYLGQIEFSDFGVFDTLIKSFPEGSNIQYGNSTPVRYSTIFRHPYKICINSNRGTSGIDGCVSTAAGAAYVNGKLTICIVGDISFFYDSNALFNNYLSPNLRIIIINNSGGNIFRFIDGPLKVPGFEKFFETPHNLSASHLASMYGIPYYFCVKQEELEGVLPRFYEPQQDKPAILEIKTDNEISARVYREYFTFLKNNRLNKITT